MNFRYEAQGSLGDVGLEKLGELWGYRMSGA